MLDGDARDRAAELPVERQVQLQHVDTRFSEQAEIRALGEMRNQAGSPGWWRLRGPLATRAACASAEAGLISGSSPLAEAVTRSAGIGP